MAITFENAIDVMNVDVSNDSVGGSNHLTEGWHKLSLSAIGEEKLTARGNCRGAKLTFSGDDGTFTTWFCTQAIEDGSRWLQKKFVNTMTRIAQCTGVTRLEQVSDLLGKPFYANVIAKEREYTSPSESLETGEPVIKKTIDNEFRNGLLGEVFLSCQEYAEKYGKTSNNFEFSL